VGWLAIHMKQQIFMASLILTFVCDTQHTQSHLSNSTFSTKRTVSDFPCFLQ